MNAVVAEIVIEVADEQLLNALVSIIWIPVPIEIDPIETHSLNAYRSIVVIEFGILTEPVNAAHSLNAYSPIDVQTLPEANVSDVIFG